MMNIEHKMKLKLTIVIGFGAKIWIQSPNLFQKFQQVWRQLHSLSIVDYPNFSMLTTLSSFISPSNTPKSFWILQSKIDGMWKFGL